MILLSDQEMAQKEATVCAWRNIQKYHFLSKNLALPIIAHELPVGTRM
jgi:hypothetical protein